MFDRIFDLFFSPKRFFKGSHFAPYDAIFAILLLWIVNVLAVFPTFKEIPFFGGFSGFSLVILGLISFYALFSASLHMFFSKQSNLFWGFPYVLIPNILTGWFISVGVMDHFYYVLLAIPIIWSVILEFYLVRAIMGKGILYTILMRLIRDFVFLAMISIIFRRWFM
ncbi:MAG: hypothetical protein C0176_05700 [Mesoaciditoga sp.]|uniref:hypothetical protein n=1 Tax=Athalassotoga sp. TaxID=2022597 RepID=UPI000CAEEEA9|nr:MAG: hypothetical protein C0185_01950 [Mesoaciditoga sp.]PMP79375.1 MAG: hypothetical protein C0176_05700 [Mesoaciditoga sp.]HEU24871.1 hypothetical protein [Mesoaciditoga lauensis]